MLPLILAADHAGFNLKENIKEYLKFLDVPFEDLGAETKKDDDDYPDYAIPAAQKVAAGGPEAHGILFCGNAVGVCVAANKIRGIRAAIGYNTTVAKTSRTDDDTNILCLAGRVLSPEYARAIVKIWLDTAFNGEGRHTRRLKKISKLEEGK